MRKLSALVLALALLGAAFFAVPAMTAGRTVAVRDNFYSFKPFKIVNGIKRMTVSKGTTVTWKWRGSLKHNVVWRRGPVRFKRSALTASNSYAYSRKLRVAGTYKVVCTVHELSDNMVMTIKVI